MEGRARVLRVLQPRRVCRARRGARARSSRSRSTCCVGGAALAVRVLATFLRCPRLRFHPRGGVNVLAHDTTHPAARGHPPYAPTSNPASPVLPPERVSSETQRARTPHALPLVQHPHARDSAQLHCGCFDALRAAPARQSRASAVTDENADAPRAPPGLVPSSSFSFVAVGRRGRCGPDPGTGSATFDGDARRWWRRVRTRPRREFRLLRNGAEKLHCRTLVVQNPQQCRG
ncbi:hypothetical protein DFH07DRAFT_505736 [Mycena maculata]|uniref:Uncharacterized protein n=1 Tax=Mycena maculata TaxID=230809 RepID=A0AAD7IZK2_9AGAR|nr:hypothetical protein DFH07DRAFT_505736 [Mycena maculata]